ncbi:hypothetical protein ACTFIR_007908 [Dictyostelium discoideum]
MIIKNLLILNNVITLQFLDYLDYSNGITTCDDENQLTRLNLYNIKLINWHRCINIQTYKSPTLSSSLTENKKLTTTTTTFSKFTNITTENTLSFLFSSSSSYNESSNSRRVQIKNIINNCIFKNNLNKSYFNFIFNENEMEINNCCEIELYELIIELFNVVIFLNFEFVILKFKPLLLFKIKLV